MQSRKVSKKIYIRHPKVTESRRRPPQAPDWGMPQGGERTSRGTDRPYIGVKGHTEAKQAKQLMN